MGPTPWAGDGIGSLLAIGNSQGKWEQQSPSPKWGGDFSYQAHLRSVSYRCSLNKPSRLPKPPSSRRILISPCMSSPGKRNINHLFVLLAFADTGMSLLSFNTCLLHRTCLFTFQHPHPFPPSHLSTIADLNNTRLEFQALTVIRELRQWSLHTPEAEG